MFKYNIGFELSIITYTLTFIGTLVGQNRKGCLDQKLHKKKVVGKNIPNEKKKRLKSHKIC